MKLVVSVLLVALVAACASRRQVIYPACPAGRGMASIHVRPSQSRARDSAASSLLFVVRFGITDGWPIPDATLTLHPDTLANNFNNALRSGRTDAQGRLRWDSLAAGNYGLLVRRVGYSVLRYPLQVLPGSRDTVEVRLREQPMC